MVKYKLFWKPYVLCCILDAVYNMPYTICYIQKPYVFLLRILLSIFLSEEDATKMHCSFVLCVLYLHSVNCAPTLALRVPAVLCSFPLLQRAGGGGLVFNFQFSTFQILSTRKVGSFSVNLFHHPEYSFQMKCQKCLKTFILMP